MKFVKKESNQKVPIKSWCYPIEDGAMNQAYNLSKLPFIYKHVALMPDCHQGYGMPIGGVIACDKVIIPNAVGVDIGCGMNAVNTNLTQISKTQLRSIINDIKESIPVGFNRYVNKQEEWLDGKEKGDLVGSIIEQEYQNSLCQVGTLGGGNHFIEIQKGSDGYIYVMLHSGSRNLGYKVAKHYNEIAKKLNEQWHSSVPLKYELAFLPIETNEAKNYMQEMKYCIKFAFENRKRMMNKIEKIFDRYTSAEFKESINIAHNYAAWENHYGKNVIVHRKGATLARKNTIGIIPGSQGTKSYIVKGLGNKESFCSCSHGAGRIMGRKQAQRKLNLSIEIEKLNSQGIIHNVKTIKDLDEAPGAYKDINIVMENQKDLVEILVELTPLGTVKG